MAVRNQAWYNLNETRCYPLDDTATALTDGGVRLPNDIITDLRLKWPELLGHLPFISAVAVTPGAVSVTIQAASTLDNSENSLAPVAVFSISKGALEEGRQYRLEAQYPQVFGYITFGSGVQGMFSGRFSSPAQSLITPRAARPHSGLPVTSIGKIHTETPLTGVVQLLGDEPIEVVKESREISGIERDVVVIRLVEDTTSAEAGVVEESVYQTFAGPCAKRPESNTCGAPEPIEFINSVAPDCDGVITLEFKGCALVGRNRDDCGIVIDCGMGLSDTCLPPFLPNNEGKLPSEVPPANIVPPLPPEPPEPPDESISDSIIIIGELPYCEGFDEFQADDWSVKSGQFVFAEDDSPEEMCGIIQPTPSLWDVDKFLGESQSESESTSTEIPQPPVIIDSSYATEGPLSASRRNVSVWQGFDVTTLYRQLTTDVKMLLGPSGSKHNAGVVINYRPHATISGRFVYYLAEVDYDVQEFRIQRFNGTTTVPAVSVSVPGITLESWYRIITRVVPKAGDTVSIVARLEGIDDPSLSVTLGPLLVNNFHPSDGRYGLHTNRAHTRFSFVNIDEYSE